MPVYTDRAHIKKEETFMGLMVVCMCVCVPYGLGNSKSCPTWGKKSPLMETSPMSLVDPGVKTEKQSPFLLYH